MLGQLTGTLLCSEVVRALCLQPALELQEEERVQLGGSEALPKHLETQETWLWEPWEVPGQVDFDMNGKWHFGEL